MHRIAIELVNPDETDVIVKDRAGRQAWLEARDYRVIAMVSAEVEADIGAQLDRLEARVVEAR